jgi:hypothetical protein
MKKDAQFELDKEIVKVLPCQIEHGVLECIR